ncbi:MAG: PA2778 family cysteine peptidase [Sideroxydans sp.]|nr:PA2778 family cysteine peptidase [Sideroxydans sp.]
MFDKICARLVTGAFFLLWLGGCATPQTQALLNANPRALPSRVELTAVPFHAQEAHQCGPAALAMAMNAAGVAVTPQQLVEQVYLPGREGSVQVEMLAATRRNGLFAYPLAPQLDDVLQEVAAGTPVVVLQNLALSWYPMWHYAVVVGYDLPRGEIILRSGLQQRQVLPLSTFEHTWARSGYWAMLAVPPGDMPKTANESDYLAAAVVLEKFITAKEAEAVYDAALKRWPDNLSALIGKGNAAYAQGDIQRAEQAYSQATQHHPESAIAFNNLAQTLSDQKRYPEALVYAKRAVSLGGAEQAAALETLQQIQNNMRDSAQTPACAACSSAK